jgi:hypothetical protein
MVMGLPVLVPWDPELVDAMYPTTVPWAGVKLMVALVLVVLTTAKLVGLFGTRLVVTGLDGSDGADVPPTFVAVTVNVYDVLAASPVTVIGLDVPVEIIASGLLVTRYWLIEPLPVGGVNATLIFVSLTTVPTTDVGGNGTVVTVNAPADDVPAELMDEMLKL